MAGDLFGMARDFMARNPQVATAVLGGLGALVLGTKTGRSVLGKAVKYGGMAMIGTLAYKAYKKHMQGETMSPAPAPGSGDEIDFSLPPEKQLPSGSGFEPESVTDQDALVMLRAMIAAAAVDGEVSLDEREAILSNLEQVGMDESAAAFIQREFNNPASPEKIAEDVRDEQTAAKVYTAARIVIDPDTYREKEFLDDLARDLRLDDGLVANIDAAARQARV